MRSGWRSVVLLIVVVGLGGGVALTALAGARRADTAVPRFLAYSEPMTGGVFFGNSFTQPPRVSGPAADSVAPPPYTSGVLSLPEVAAYGRVLYLFTATNGNAAGVVNTFGVADPSVGRKANRPYVVAGRFPDPAAPLEVGVNELAASRLHLRVGSTIHLHSYSLAQAAGLTGNPSSPGRPSGPSYVLRVSGVLRFPSDVNAIVPLAARQDVNYEGQQDVFLTPAFVAQMAHEQGVKIQQMPGMNVFGVRLRHGTADWHSFVVAAKALAARTGTSINFQEGDPLGSEAAARSAQRGTHVEAVALALFGGLAALVTLLLVGQAVIRQLRSDARDRATLRSLGASRFQLAALGMVAPSVVALGGAVLAFAVSALASPLMPIGLARTAEIHPGFAVNVAITVGGAACLAVILTAGAAWPAWRAGRPDLPHSTAVRSSRPLRVWPAGSGPLTAQVGIRFAFGSRTAPVFTALVGALTAVAGLTAALTFAGSLDHLVRTPVEQGWNWDVMAGNPNNSQDDVGRGGALLAADPKVEAYSAIGILGPVDVDGTTVPQMLAIDQLKGGVHPPVLDGRAPSAPDEIAFATRTLEALHKHVGDRVTMTGPDAKPTSFTIVGRMLAPSVGDVLDNGLGEGAWVDASFVHQQWRSPTDPNGTPQPGTDVLNVFAIRLAPDVSVVSAMPRLRQDFGETVLQHLPAEDAVNLQSVSGLPFALAALIGLLGVATIGNALVNSVRQRRKELAVLKTLGFVRRQVGATVAWQATSFAFVALAMGIPLGLAGGRWAWTAVASGIYSASPPLVPVLAVVLVVPATVLVCNAVAAWPARSAGRLAPALALRRD